MQKTLLQCEDAYKRSDAGDGRRANEGDEGRKSDRENSSYQYLSIVDGAGGEARDNRQHQQTEDIVDDCRAEDDTTGGRIQQSHRREYARRNANGSGNHRRPDKQRHYTSSTPRPDQQPSTEKRNQDAE